MNTLLINLKAWKPKNTLHAQQLRRFNERKDWKLEDRDFDLRDMKAKQGRYNNYTSPWQKS